MQAKIIKYELEFSFEDILNIVKKLSYTEQQILIKELNKNSLKKNFDAFINSTKEADISEEDILEELRAVRYGSIKKN